MTWKELFNTKIADGRTVFEFLFGDGIVEVDESIMDKPIGENVLPNINHQLKRDGIDALKLVNISHTINVF